MNHKTNKVYNSEELNDKIADYVTGKLSAEEGDIFENSMLKYPDLLIEVNQLKQMMSKVDKDAYNKFLSTKTRNISVNVNKRIESKHSDGYKNWIKYFSPVFALSLLVILIFIFSRNDVTINDGNKYGNNMLNKDIRELLDKNFKTDTNLILTDFAQFSYDPLMQDINISNENDISDEINNIISDNLFEGIDIQPKDLQLIPEEDLIEILDNSKVKDFQNLLEEYGYVKVNS